MDCEWVYYSFLGQNGEYFVRKKGEFGGWKVMGEMRRRKGQVLERDAAASMRYRKYMESEQLSDRIPQRMLSMKYPPLQVRLCALLVSLLFLPLLFRSQSAHSVECR